MGTGTAGRLAEPVPVREPTKPYGTVSELGEHLLGSLADQRRKSLELCEVQSRLPTSSMRFGFKRTRCAVVPQESNDERKADQEPLGDLPQRTVSTLDR